MKTPELPPFDYQPKPYTGPSAEEVLRLRKQFLNPGIFLYYKKPIMFVEGRMQYLFDETGRRYLDALGGIVTRTSSKRRGGRTSCSSIRRRSICIRTSDSTRRS